MADTTTETEYFRWPESVWIAPDIDWQSGNIIVGGCDVGSTSTQMVILVDGRLYAYSSIRSRGKSEESAPAALEKLMEQTDISPESIEYTVGTGYGRVTIPFANRQVTEISCHARGANFLYGDSVRTILDMGGQDLKVIRCDEKGKVKNFLMNDKCAAGTGRGMETLADLLSVPIDKVGDMAAGFKGEGPYISPMCVVFSKTDALRAYKEGAGKESILASYCKSTARQVFHFLKTIGVRREFCITGGIAKNKAVVREVERLVGIRALSPDFDTQIVGAVGAALYAQALCEKSRD